MDQSALLRKGRHPAFSPPTELNIKIWRYMDLTQFVSMLEERGLLFTRADLLDDKFEGTMSRPLWDFLESDVRIRNSMPGIFVSQRAGPS